MEVLLKLIYLICLLLLFFLFSFFERTALHDLNLKKFLVAVKLCIFVIISAWTEVFEVIQINLIASNVHFNIVFFLYKTNTFST
jgi:hypothetical protein